MIIAIGVNNKPRVPSGPARESTRYTIRPTTTGGRPIKAFKRTTIVVLPGNRKTARAAPNGKPIKLAARTAAKLTCKDKTTISAKLPSKFKIREKAAANASLKFDIYSDYPNESR